MDNPYAHGCAYVADAYLPLEQAAIPMTDWGFLRGDCVYDAIPFADGMLFRVQDHIERFWESMEKWRLSCPKSQAEVRNVCHEVVSKSQLRSGLLLIITTRGMPPDLTIRNPALFSNRFYAFAQVLPPIVDPERLKAGLKIVVSKTPRIPEESVDATAKNFQWGDFIQARLQAHDQNADNAILLDYDGNLTEGPGFNVFLLQGQQLSTPSHHCLKGITRRTVLEIGADMGLEVSERDIPLSEIHQADEVFFASSAGGLFPVTEVDGTTVGSGSVGPKTSEITEEYWRWRRDPARCDAVDYSGA